MTTTTSKLSGTELIAQERQRQIDGEGWTAEHDDEHTGSLLAWAAVCYAAPGLVFVQQHYANEVHFVDPWPWEKRWDNRPHNGNVVLPNVDHLNAEQRIRQLTIAGALIAAEIDRLQRGSN